MKCGTAESGASAERLDEILAGYLLAAERGEAPAEEAFIAAHPEATGELREFFANRRDFAGLAMAAGEGPLDVESTMRLSAGLGEHFEVDPASPEPQPGLPRYFGDYVLLEEIGRGGMGVVFKARQIGLNRIVALKRILSGRLASPEEVKRFRFEAEAIATLDHPNMIQIFEVGEHHGQQYFTMKLMEGGSLAKRVREFEGRAKETALLVANIAHAVHHAHQRLILHRDLKPSNVLIDDKGKPHVTDFGLACREGAHDLTVSGAVLGAPGYMSPEQAAGRVKAITTASDVYSLGAILYDLLTGRPPFRGETITETIRQVIEREPQRPRSINRRTDLDLEAVCLKCLEKEPSRRYGSALGLAKDLERYLAGQPVEARHVGRTQRAWRWCLRYPMWAASMAAAAVLLVIMTLAALSAARTQQREVLESAKEANRFAAEHAASTVLLQLRHFERAVIEAASNEDLRLELARLAGLPDKQRIKKAELVKLDGLMEGLRTRLNQKYRVDEHEPFDSWFTQDINGIGLVRAPLSPEAEWTGSNFQSRDYFKGALAKANERPLTPYVSGVFTSYSNRKAKFAISLPVLGDDGQVKGVLAGTLTIGATFGPKPLSKPPRQVVLVGPEDPSMPDAPGTATRQATRPSQPLQYVVVFDRSLKDQPEHVTPVHSERLRAFGEALKDGDMPKGTDAIDDNYEDPIIKGRWLAAFAQVGDTGLIVIVQTPYDNPLAPGRTLARTLMTWLVVALAIGGALFLVAGLYAHRKESRR